MALTTHLIFNADTIASQTWLRGNTQRRVIMQKCLFLLAAGFQAYDWDRHKCRYSLTPWAEPWELFDLDKIKGWLLPFHMQQLKISFWGIFLCNLSPLQGNLQMNHPALLCYFSSSNLWNLFLISINSGQSLQVSVSSRLLRRWMSWDNSQLSDSFWTCENSHCVYAVKPIAYCQGSWLISWSWGSFFMFKVKDKIGWMRALWNGVIAPWGSPFWAIIGRPWTISKSIQEIWHRKYWTPSSRGCLPIQVHLAKWVRQIWKQHLWHKWNARYCDP